MALQSKELIFNKKNDKSAGFLVRGETYFFFSIHTTITNPKSKDHGKKGDLII